MYINVLSIYNASLTTGHDSHHKDIPIIQFVQFTEVHDLYCRVFCEGFLNTTVYHIFSIVCLLQYACKSMHTSTHTVPFKYYTFILRNYLHHCNTTTTTTKNNNNNNKSRKCHHDASSESSTLIICILITFVASPARGMRKRS